MTKYAQSVTNSPHSSSTHFVTKIGHQHQLRTVQMPTLYCIDPVQSSLFQKIRRKLTQFELQL